MLAWKRLTSVAISYGEFGDMYEYRNKSWSLNFGTKVIFGSLAESNLWQCSNFDTIAIAIVLMLPKFELRQHLNFCSVQSLAATAVRAGSAIECIKFNAPHFDFYFKILHFNKKSKSTI